MKKLFSLIITLFINISLLYPQAANNFNENTSRQTRMTYFTPMDKGIRVPEYNTLQRDGLYPPSGFVIYNHSSESFEFYNHSIWRKFTPPISKLPIVSTTNISDISATRAISGGTITSDDDFSITARGICWSTQTSPTVADSITSDSIGDGDFTSHMKGLMGNTTYFVRAYATNRNGTGYGNEVTFKTPPFNLLCTYGIDSVTLKIEDYDNHGGVEWQESIDSIHWTTIPGAVNDTYQFIPAQTHYYRAMIKASPFESLPSVTILVNHESLSNYLPETLAYVSGLSTPLSTAQKKKIDTLVKDLKTGLNITHLSDFFDVFYVLANETAEVGLRNLAKRSHDAVGVNSPTFTPFEGFAGDGVSSFIDTNYNPSNQGVNFTANNGMIGYYSNTNSQVSGCDFGSKSNTPSYLQLYPVNYGFTAHKVNQSANGITISSGSTFGLSIVTRVSETTINLYKSGVRSTIENASLSIPNAKLFIGARSTENRPDSYTNRQISFAFCGKSVTDQQAHVISKAIDKYMNSVVNASLIFKSLDKYLFINPVNKKVYSSSTPDGPLTFLFQWDDALAGGHDLSEWSMAMMDNGDVVCIWRTECITTGSDDNIRKNPILYPSSNYESPYILDFGTSVKPSGWFGSVGYDVINGSLVFCEYTRPSVPKARVWKVSSPISEVSNWQIVKEFTLSGNISSGFKHCHAIQQDPYTGIVYLTTGDDNTAAAVYYSNDGCNTFNLLYGPDEKTCRLLNFIFTEDKIYWASDTAIHSYHFLFSAKRDANGLIDPLSITELYQFPHIPGLATYHSVYLSAINCILFLDRYDSRASTMPLRLWDLTNNLCVTIDTLTSIDMDIVNLGFRCEAVEIYPEGNTFMVGFGENIAGLGDYKNYISKLDNDNYNVFRRIFNLLITVNRVGDTFEVSYATKRTL